MNRVTGIGRTWIGIGVAAMFVLAYGTGRGGGIRALSPDSAPPLPAPSGTVVNVSSAGGLQAAVAALASNTTIVIAPGTYNLTSTLWVAGPLSNVTIRGASDSRDDVVLVGHGMGVADNNVPFGIWSGNGVTGLTIADLTIRDIYQHAIVFNAGTQSPHVYNVHLIDAGEQFIKANPDGSGGGVNNGVVEYSVFEYTDTAPNDYTNGVDVHTGQNWIVRHNLFRRIRAPQGLLAGPAILMWNGSSGSIADGNTFIDCQREISFGLISNTPNDHTGGIIRNNFIVRGAGMGGDVGIAVFDSPGTTVAHNTILLNGQYPNAIEYRFADTTGVTIVNNLADSGAQARDGASASLQGNVWTASSSWFVNPTVGDLHLKSTATGAIDRGVSTSAAPLDWDAETRPAGGAPDVGADEYVAGAPPDITAPTVAVAAPATGATVSGTISLLATASDNVGVAGVWFTLDGSTVGSELASAPFGENWNTASASNGSHVLRAAARDAAGNTATSPPVTITVDNAVPDLTPPTVALTAPASGSTVSGTITVAASASDNVGVAGVQFTLDGTPLGAEDLVPPYRVSWATTGAGNGAHTLRAIARDASGNARTSASRTVTVANSQTAVPGDLNGDGLPDLLFEHQNGQLYSWFLSGGVLTGGGSLSPGAVDPSWRAVSLDDFNGDGRTDLLWWRPSTGQVAVWLMNGLTMTASIELATVNPLWHMAATGDLNGDGHTDIVWQHANGTLYAWLLDGTSLVSAVPLAPAKVAPQWAIAGVADLNGDHHADLIWQNSTTGALYVWYMNGVALQQGAAFSPAAVPPAWHLRAVADFDNDGAPDLVFQNTATGQLYAWYLSGSTLAREGFLTPGQVNLAWNVVGGR